MEALVSFLWAPAHHAPSRTAQRLERRIVKLRVTKRRGRSADGRADTLHVPALAGTLSLRRIVREGVAELGPGADAELGEDLVQVVADGPGR